MFDYTLWRVYTSDINLILAAIPIMLVVWSVIGAVFYRRMRVVGAALAVLAAALILYKTIISRGSSEAGIDLIPFSSFVRARTNPEMYREMLMNVLLFIPLGLSLPFVIGGGIAKRILLTVLAGFLLTVTVEAVQCFVSIGLAETDDVICNTLGALLGSLAYSLSMLWRRLFAKKTERENN